MKSLLRRMAMGIGLCVSLGACAHQTPRPHFTEAAFAKQVKAYEGKSVWDVIDAQGYPNRQFVNPNGMTVYEYVRFETFTRPMYAYTHPSPYPLPAQTEIIGGETATLSCRVWFELDKAEKTVTKVRFKGDACYAPES